MTSRKDAHYLLQTRTAVLNNDTVKCNSGITLVSVMLPETIRTLPGK